MFGFGLGSSTSHRFLQKACRITRGAVELVNEGARLQPKVSLYKNWFMNTFQVDGTKAITVYACV